MGIRTKGRSAVQKCLCVMLGLSFVAATLAIDGSLDVPSLCIIAKSNKSAVDLLLRFQFAAEYLEYGMRIELLRDMDAVRS